MERLAAPILVLVLTTLTGACGGSSTDQRGIFSTDQTVDAGKLVDEANGKLRAIKKRFKENEPKYEELKLALTARDEAKVKSISTQFKEEITAGTAEGEEAIEKLKTARDMRINPEYRKYLELKIDALELYIEAFELRRQAAALLAENYDPKDAARTEKVRSEFKAKEDKFTELADEARKLSGDANDLARESLRKKRN